MNIHIKSGNDCSDQEKERKKETKTKSPITTPFTSHHFHCLYYNYGFEKKINTSKILFTWLVLSGTEKKGSL